MGAAEQFELISESDYLARESLSDTKHEYSNGVVYAMAGAKNRHNRVATRVSTALGRRMGPGNPCEPFNSDTKVRIRQITGTRFYYPDLMVICQPNPEDDSFQDNPSIIVEVSSESTRRIDEGEKKDAYLMIPSLTVYLMVDPDTALMIAHRRTERGFEREVYAGLDATVPLPGIEAELPLSEVYEGLESVPD